MTYEIIAMAALATATVTFGVSSDAQAQGRGRGGPPAEAYAACDGKVAGDACSFECPRGGPVEGICRVRWDDRLSCVPKDRGPRGRRGPGRRGGPKR
jgi:hypothetical protein